MNNEELREIQNQIGGYQFKNTDLLQQAFVRRSYSKENGGENNEILEFYGDRALEIAIAKIFSNLFGYFTSDYEEYDPEEDWNEYISEYDEHQLTEMKAQLVSKFNLSRCIDNLGLADYLIMGKGDIKNGVGKKESVKEDLFEAILGAIAIDSDWNINEIQNAAEIMLNFDEDSLNGEVVNYIQEIHDWTAKNTNDTPHYEYLENNTYGANFYFNGISQKQDWGERYSYQCRIHINDSMPTFRGYGDSKSEARRNVCELVHNYLVDHDMLLTIKDEIENPRMENAINDLEILARRGYFSIPEYTFSEEHDEDGNSIWICECHIEEEEVFFYDSASTKKKAKKKAAYEMLLHVLCGPYDDEYEGYDE